MPFDDLPARYRANVNQDIPFKPLPNGQPRLNAQDVRALEAFLRTLTDGYVPPPVKLLMRSASR